MSKDKLFKGVAIPHGLSEAQGQRARDYVKGHILEGLTIAELAKKYSISTSTLYDENHLKNIVFNRYVNMLTAVLATDELEDFRVIANNIKMDALKPSATHKDREMYLNVFSWVVDYSNELEKKKHGLGSKIDNNELSLDDRRKALFAKRIPTPKKETGINE